MSVPFDITGKKFGYLTALELVPYDKRKNSYKRREWLCQCDCGNKTIVEQRFLTDNGKQRTVSCGCIRIRSHLIVTSKCDWLTLDYLLQFKDWKKFSFLHKVMMKNIGLGKIDKNYYFSFIEKFYNDNQFNTLYNNWLKNKDDKYTFYDLYRPSLDHILPKSKGGTDSLDNLQFLTLFENLSKRDMTMAEWEEFKIKTHSQSDLFYGGD